MANKFRNTLDFPTQGQNTLDNCDPDGSAGEEDSDPCWGRLLSINKLFTSINLYENEYSLGRNAKCKIVLDSPLIQQSKYFLAYSSVHFKITREQTGSHTYTYLQDTSSNGTFINGDKVGKNNRHVLQNNAEIALASKSNRVYVYIDISAKEDITIPPEIREKYMMSKEIGRGAYGAVRLAFMKGTCERFAIKIIQKKHFTTYGTTALAFNKQIESECTILKQLNHPCIIRIFDVIDTKETVYIILELVEGGELFDRVVSQGQFDEQTTKCLFEQMCQAIKYLHEQSITHRDIKPENILLCQPDTNETLVKITDFGLSRFFDETNVMKTFCGTPNYLVGYPPFSETPELPCLTDQIVKGLYTFPKEFWSGISNEVIDLIKKMMNIDPVQRLSIQQVLEHPWLLNDKDNKEKVHKLMYGPTTATLPIATTSNKRKSDNDGGTAEVPTPIVDTRSTSKKSKK
ncbi:unnamed protein product [Didymodactylos carnosus]|uniref:Uncharacterized protein n=1 Tax=Didymodactylos carnosus TaxID=1234261 RepID=A0A815DB29_9BILA|nr:unnamed protein product [Didymodactylos carnosus]CAF1295546.1 unnamed protein product [Didymodactylos carnosus]CAF3702684.1 unnamed protein product [Didymodactylos carnosus]CAF4109594.1 unnamed protein product [Didymodactylos carnosus]